MCNEKLGGQYCSHPRQFWRDGMQEQGASEGCRSDILISACGECNETFCRIGLRRAAAQVIHQSADQVEARVHRIWAVTEYVALVRDSSHSFHHGPSPGDIVRIGS